MGLTIDGKRACYYVTEAMTRRHNDDTIHYYPAIVREDEAGYSPTNYDYGTDFARASETVAELNKELGRSESDVLEIVASSMGAQRRAERPVSSRRR